MKLNSVIISAGVGALAVAALSVSPATSAPGSKHDAAVKACTTANLYQPVDVIAAIDNGTGYTLVWLTDTDGDLWMCHADNKGSIYVYESVEDDLLEGAGPDMISLQFTSSGDPMGKPQEIAEKVCTAAASVQPAHVVASRPDGLSGDWISGYSVFLEDDAGDFYLCNASADAAIWAFASIGDPLEFDGEGAVS